MDFISKAPEPFVQDSRLSCTCIRFLTKSAPYEPAYPYRLSANFIELWKALVYKIYGPQLTNYCSRKNFGPILLIKNWLFFEEISGFSSSIACSFIPRRSRFLGSACTNVNSFPRIALDRTFPSLNTIAWLRTPRPRKLQ